MDEELTDAQRIFCSEYIRDWNGTRAYKAAYPNATTDNTAAVNAHKLLRNTKISAYIEEIQKDLQKLAGVSALRNMEELRKIAYSDLTDLKKDWLTEKEFDELTPDQKACISEITAITRRYGKDGEEKIIKFKLHSKLDAIDKLNKMLPGAYAPERKEVTGKGGAELYIGRTDKELIDLYERYRKITGEPE